MPTRVTVLRLWYNRIMGLYHGDVATPAADFVYSRPRAEKPADVVRAAKRLGIKVSLGTVYHIRNNLMVLDVRFKASTGAFTLHFFDGKHRWIRIPRECDTFGKAAGWARSFFIKRGAGLGLPPRRV